MTVLTYNHKPKNKILEHLRNLVESPKNKATKISLKAQKSTAIVAPPKAKRTKRRIERTRTKTRNELHLCDIATLINELKKP
jgi:hypothetical protein